MKKSEPACEEDAAYPQNDTRLKIWCSGLPKESQTVCRHHVAMDALMAQRMRVVIRSASPHGDVRVPS
ncbi:MAG: hypothetical protein A4E19_04195 [Nitrospira sp. SG-bin1]|nr:MAG: hypothetical protein A4E19_04195 [Nitrospira sp. SG-bin1]